MTKTLTTSTYRIESFKNAFGETRFRFAVESILNPGTMSRSLRSWPTRAACQQAARRCGYNSSRIADDRAV